MKATTALLSMSFLLLACGPDLTLNRVPDIVQDPTPERLTTSQCFWGTTPNGARVPMTKIIHELRADTTGDRVDVTIIFNREFVDLTYGANAIGWDGRKKGHSFRDLYKSDHTELALLDAAGDVAFQAKLDLLSESADHDTGYGSLGTNDGDGELITGDDSYVLSTGSSLDDNLNARGYELFEDSPETDEAYTSNADYPEWDFYVRYHLSVALEAFGKVGFGSAEMASVHASPSKLGTDTITVDEDDCPDPSGGGQDDPFGPDLPNGGAPGGQTGDGTPASPDV